MNQKRTTFGLISGGGLAAAGLLAVLGAILPWAEAPFGISKAGVEGDGAITLVFGLVVGGIGGLWLFDESSRARKWIAVIAGGLLSALVLVVAIYDIADVERLADDADGLVKVGAGLYVTAIAGGLGVASALAGLLAPATRTDPLRSTSGAESGSQPSTGAANGRRLDTRWLVTGMAVVAAFVVGFVVGAALSDGNGDEGTSNQDPEWTLAVNDVSYEDVDAIGILGNPTRVTHAIVDVTLTYSESESLPTNLGTYEPEFEGIDHDGFRTALSPLDDPDFGFPMDYRFSPGESVRGRLLAEWSADQDRELVTVVFRSNDFAGTTAEGSVEILPD